MQNGKKVKRYMILWRKRVYEQCKQDIIYSFVWEGLR